MIVSSQKETKNALPLSTEGDGVDGGWGWSYDPKEANTNYLSSLLKLG